MNNIRQVQALNKRELEHAVPPEASWHADYRDTAYIYIGGLPFDLSEGDIVTIFSQYGEPVHVNLVRDKETGKSRGFAFLKYEDQRSTDLAVDNLGGATVLGRILRVDHTRYKKRDEEEDTNNVAKLMGETAGKEADGERDDEGRRRKRRGNSEEREPLRRRLLKEEIELEELIRNHDDEDPMKEFLIEEKKEEVARALEKEARKEKSTRRLDIPVTIIAATDVTTIDRVPEKEAAAITKSETEEIGLTETELRSVLDPLRPAATEIDMIVADKTWT
ncbi:hypothetical protein BDW68DRAFT_176854 [Aspergillus falconensis]